MKRLMPMPSANSASAPLIAELIVRMVRLVAFPLSTWRWWIAGVMRRPTTATISKSATASRSGRDQGGFRIPHGRRCASGTPTALGPRRSACDSHQGDLDLLRSIHSGTTFCRVYRSWNITGARALSRKLNLCFGAMQKSIAIIVFNVGGTLVDCVRHILESWQELQGG